MQKKTTQEANSDDSPLLICSMNVQGLEKKYTFSMNELKNLDTVKNKLFLVHKELYNQLKKNAESSSRFYDRIKNIT